MLSRMDVLQTEFRVSLMSCPLNVLIVNMRTLKRFYAGCAGEDEQE